MKSLPLTIALALALSATATLAADPPKTTPETARPMQPMDHGKMDMAEKTPAERQKMIDEAFSAIDTNKDGALSKAEFGTHINMMMAMRHDKMKMDHDGDHGAMDMGGMGHDKMPAEHKKMAMDMFSSLDKNHDGNVTKAEIPANHPLLMHFEMIDTNKDGKLSQAEFAKHHGM